jgi:hypothetical protein
MSGSAVVDQMLGYVWKDLKASLLAGKLAGAT